MKAPTVKVASGTVPATHMHPSYGPCVIINRLGVISTVHTSNGTAAVMTRSLYPIKETR
jgi:hypothetical protein